MARDLKLDELPLATVYTALRRLELRGMLTSRWGEPGPSGGNRRRWYTATTDASTDPLADGTDMADGAEAPGLIEIVVGQPPEGWVETQPLAEPLRSDTRYTVATSPDDQTVDFALPDLAQGLLFDGVGRSQFNQDLMQEPCSEPADVGSFVSNIAILALLGVTTAAFVLVALISLLFVVTRRFGRIKAMERKARRAQRPSTRSSN